MKTPFENKNIILGVTGSIAAYKAVELASRLTQLDAPPAVILTASAEKFISPLTFQSVTGRKAYTERELWGGEGHIVHIGLGRATDLLVIAPASANTIAKLAHGIADNLLTVTALASHSPMLIAPAMDAGMYGHKATQDNIHILSERGVFFIGPAEGHLASGLVGPGRMVEAVEIIGKLRWILSREGPLKGKKIIVTAGGTREPIDPVRFIANRSSGKQGFAIAQAGMDYGAEVILISGPVQLPEPPGCKRVNVNTAQEMLNAVQKEAVDADVLIMAAAVADFSPKHFAPQKIKKSQASLPVLELEHTPDILQSIGEIKKTRGYPKYIIGFAAETSHMIENARAKMVLKNLDCIVANDVTSQDSGFEVDTNRVTLLYSDGSQEEFPVMTKMEVAETILSRICKWF